MSPGGGVLFLVVCFPAVKSLGEERFPTPPSYNTKILKCPLRNLFRRDVIIHTKKTT